MVFLLLHLSHFVFSFFGWGNFAWVMQDGGGRTGHEPILNFNPGLIWTQFWPGVEWYLFTLLSNYRGSLKDCNVWRLLISTLLLKQKQWTCRTFSFPEKIHILWKKSAIRGKFTIQGIHFGSGVEKIKWRFDAAFPSWLRAGSQFPVLKSYRGNHPLFIFYLSLLE